MGTSFGHNSLDKLTATLCLTIAVLLGSPGMSWSTEPVQGFCFIGTKHSHCPVSGQCSAAYESGNYTTALREWKFLAKNGNSFAQFNLGQLYNRGQGIPQDDKEAVQWFRLAAEQGNVFAQYNLGLKYAKGRDVPQDYKTAVKWFTLAAEQGVARAQVGLGVMYLNGRGVPQDDKTAVKWWTLAAKRGNADAQFQLGWMYDKGTGVIQDNVYAHMWSNIAASSGNKDATKNRDIIAKRMTPFQLEKAQKLARKFVPKKSAPIVTARTSPPPQILQFPKGPMRPDDIAVIIANSNYGKLGKGIPNVKPAYTDAKNTKRYFTEALEPVMPKKDWFF